MESNVLGFEISVYNFMKTEIVLRLEYVPDYLFGFPLRQDISLFYQLEQVAVAVFKE
jgi:hypothetical protein